MGLSTATRRIAANSTNVNTAVRRTAMFPLLQQQQKTFSASTPVQQSDIDKIKREQLANLNTNKQKSNEDKSQNKQKKKSFFRSLFTGLAAGSGFAYAAYYLLTASLIEAQNNIKKELSTIENVKTSSQLEQELMQQLEQEHGQLLVKRALARSLPSHETQLYERFMVDQKRKWNSWFHNLSDVVHRVELDRQKKEVELLHDRILTEAEVCFVKCSFFVAV